MGIGGNLMWTALARHIYINEKKKVVFVSNSGIIKLDIWKNNPHISYNTKDKNIKIIKLIFKILPERINNNNWIVDKHTIVSRCKYFWDRKS